MDPRTALDLLRAALDDERRALAAGDLGAPVLACPGWSLLDLGSHLVENLCWARGAVVEGHPRTVTPPTPADQLLPRFDDAAGALLETLAATAPDTPCWTFGPKPSVAAFWFRRLVHEHTVHAVDAAATLGQARPVAPAVALDGIDEIIDMIFPRQVRLGRMAPLERSLAVQPTAAQRDAERAVGRDGERAGARSRVLAGDGLGAGPPAADAAVTGPPDLLYLLLWRRIGPDDPRLRVTGDPAAARAVLATPIVP